MLRLFIIILLSKGSLKDRGRNFVPRGPGARNAQRPFKRCMDMWVLDGWGRGGQGGGTPEAEAFLDYIMVTSNYINN